MKVCRSGERAFWRSTLESASALLFVVALMYGSLQACGGSHPSSVAPQSIRGVPDLSDVPSSTGACQYLSLVDDGEDGSNATVVALDRAGYWFTYADPATVDDGMTPLPPNRGGVFLADRGGANGSTWARRLKGRLSTADIRFAGMGFNFRLGNKVYDASSYDALVFWARRQPGSAVQRIKVKVSDASTDPAGSGNCGDNCYNDFAGIVRLEPGWRRYVLPFEDLKQEQGWGAPTPPHLTSSEIYSVMFQTPLRSIASALSGNGCAVRGAELDCGRPTRLGAPGTRPAPRESSLTQPTS